ncbi:molybdopterin-dependent oxidoreductase [Limisalsivibrio acetivorans]|uniref:molybdopterin-dependent oxidoreductase n=1 Tax=Limisalsivibrio acetivorans TaxID=1304888 RepID=UPI0003B31FC1|nr:molybdopterin-dependent oxidoreductase [Limisalsivibrio acetivorans]
MTKLSRRSFLKSAVAVGAGAGLGSFQPRASAAELTPVDYGIMEKVSMRCRMCAQHCPMVGHVQEGRLVRIESNKNSPHPSICGRGRAAMGALYNPDRIKSPLIRVGERGEGKFRKATWDEAIALVADKLKSYRDEGHPEAVSYLPRFTSSAGLDKLFFGAYGTPNTVGYGDTCFANSLGVSFGGIMGGSVQKGVPKSGSASWTPDYERAKYGVLISRNPGGGLVAFPWAAMFGLGKKNGLSVTVVDPRRPSEAGESDQDWLPIRPGTDSAFLLGVMNVIISNKYYDEDFIRKYTNADMLVDTATGLPLGLRDVDGKADYMVADDSGNIVYREVSGSSQLFGTFEHEGREVKTGFQMIAETAEQYTPEWAEKVCDVKAADIRRVAENLNRHKPAVFIERGYRTTRYANSMNDKKIIVMLNVMLGNIAAEGGMLTPRKMKVGSYRKAPKSKVKSVGEYFRQFSEYYLHDTSHYRRLLFKAILEGKPYPVKMVFTWGQNPVGGSAGGYKIAEALEKVDSVVCVSPFYNETCMYADVILPDATFMERDEEYRTKWKSPYPTVAGHFKAVDPLFDTKEGSWIMNEIARNVLDADTYEELFGEFDRRGIDAIWEAQLASIKGLNEREQQDFTITGLKENGMWCGETHSKVKAKTPTGRIELYSTFFAETHAELVQRGTELADYGSPLPLWTEPYWHGRMDAMESDTFIPITGFSPLGSFGGSQTKNNPLLAQFGDKIDWDAVFINKEKGAAMGLSDGDMVDIFNIEQPEMVTKARVMLSSTVHPDALFTWYGTGAGYLNRSAKMQRYAPQYGFNPNHVSNFNFAPLDAGHLAQDFIVRVRRSS